MDPFIFEPTHRYFQDAEFRIIWNEYLIMRKRIRRPMTEWAKKLAFDTLDRLTGDIQEAKGIINQSIMNSWQGLFPLKSNDDDFSFRSTL